MEAQYVESKISAPPMAEFEAMLNESLDGKVPREGTVIAGRVIGIENHQAIIDVGFKTEGRVDLKEFARPGREVDVKVGEMVDVYLDRIENSKGEAVLSREKANREAAWDRLEQANNQQEHVEGLIIGRVKGGFSVDLDGASAFLPGSQVDIRPVNSISTLMTTPQPFQIVKMDRRRGNIVVSRRAVLEESSAAERSKVLENLNRGDIIEGMVKNIVEFGAFVDLGGIDGLLHVTDMAWRRVNHPSEVVSVGDPVKVQVIKVNKDSQRISLGMKQLLPDPWENVSEKYPTGMKLKGRVANITEFGAFVEIEPGVEGLIHVSEMSWTKKNVPPGKIVSSSQEVEVMVLNTDGESRRISLGLKQCLPNPWEVFADENKAGSVVEGTVRSFTEYGMFIGLDGGIDGMVHLTELSWDSPGEEEIKKYKKGEIVKAVVLDTDAEKERISLGIKQVGGDPFAEATSDLKKGSVVVAIVTSIEAKGVEVDLDGVTCFIRSSDLSRERSEQRPDRFSLDQKVEARVMSIDRSARRLSLSIKAHEIEIEEEAKRQYGSAASGARLGEILAPALQRRSQEEGETTEGGESAGDDAVEASAETEDSAGTATESQAAADTEINEEAAEMVASSDESDNMAEQAGEDTAATVVSESTLDDTESAEETESGAYQRTHDAGETAEDEEAAKASDGLSGPS